MITLLIDTSNKALSVAINKDGVLLSDINANVKKTHSETLVHYIDHVVKYADVRKSDIERIIVARGPGSYTGVRIGVTVAKTLASRFGIKLYSVSSLFALAASSGSHGRVAPMFDARRGNVFSAVYDISEDGFKEVLPPQHIEYDRLAEGYSPDEVSYFGDRTEKFAGHVTGFAHLIPKISVVEKYPEALTKENVHHMVPEYLRVSEAERNWMEKNQ